MNIITQGVYGDTIYKAGIINPHGEGNSTAWLRQTGWVGSFNHSNRRGHVRYGYSRAVIIADRIIVIVGASSSDDICFGIPLIAGDGRREDTLIEATGSNRLRHGAGPLARQI